jgi:hypothetical protein
VIRPTYSASVSLARAGARRARPGPPGARDGESTVDAELPASTVTLPGYWRRSVVPAVTAWNRRGSCSGRRRARRTTEGALRGAPRFRPFRVLAAVRRIICRVGPVGPARASDVRTGSLTRRELRRDAPRPAPGAPDRWGVPLYCGGPAVVCRASAGPMVSFVSVSAVRYFKAGAGERPQRQSCWNPGALPTAPATRPKGSAPRARQTVGLPSQTGLSALGRSLPDGHGP